MHFGKAFSATCLAAAVSSHMIMKTPTPYGADSLNNSPLVADGSDYPCKQRPGVYGGSAKNEMAVGAPQQLSFTGSAVHGGGSCQLSLTKDLKPTKSTKFSVILSIEGGCPANTAGNLGEDPNGSGASVFTYSIPKDVAPGDYTLAWTWFNKIGNREMYMNCAPITVTGSKKRDLNATEAFDLDDNILPKRDLSSLPDMFKANILSVSGTCHTADSADLAFPNPGSVVQKKGSSPLTPPVGSCSSSSSSSGSSGSSAGSAGSATPAQPSVAAQPSAAVQPSAAAQPSAAVQPSAAAQPSASSSGSGAGSGSSAGSATSSSSSSGAASSGGITCSSDGTQFQMPGGPMQAVAAGTKCVDGAIQMAKRSAKFRGAFQV